MSKTKSGFKNLYLHILSILLIGGIGVQTLTSCSSYDGGGDTPPLSDTSSSSDDGNFSSSSDGGGNSSSSVSGNYSSSVVPSSSSVVLSSSSAVLSSSSAVPISYCNYGGCALWGSDGWTCLEHVNGYPNAGGCYPMPTEDNCVSGIEVSSCPIGTIPPGANYGVPISSSAEPSSSSSVPSSSSVTPSSSSVVPSSSSAVLSSSSAVPSSSSIVPSSSSAMPSSSSVSNDSPTIFADIRDGKTYKKVTIGTQTWMAENLNYNPGTGISSCYDGQANYCEIYGRLYNWATAMTVCPSGWHLPSQADWNMLTAYIGGQNTEGKKLKATSGWNYGGNGTDDYGFSALPGGIGNPGRNQGSSSEGFRSVGSDGIWWSASAYNSNEAYFRGMSYRNEDAYWNNNLKSYLFSVRCLQD